MNVYTSFYSAQFANSLASEAIILKVGFDGFLS